MSYMFGTFCFVVCLFSFEDLFFLGFSQHNYISPDFIAQLTDKVLDDSRNWLILQVKTKKKEIMI